jgi:hypothetical protein
MYVSFSLGSLLRLLAVIAVGAVIVGVLLAQPSGHEQVPADVTPPQVVQSTGSSPMAQ